MNIGFVIDPLSRIKPHKDTSFALMLEGQKRGYNIFYMTLGDLVLDHNKPMAHVRQIKVVDATQDYFEIINEDYIELASFDVIMMRKDPPFDIEYIMATYILEAAENEGVYVLNKPRSLRDANEKVFTTNFPECIPASLLTRSKTQINLFIEQHGKSVIKPTDKMGGQSIYIIEAGDLNRNIIIEDMTQRGSRFVQLQKYLPQIKTEGDKRILIIDGEAIPYGITRIPAEDDHRGNMAVGAIAKGFSLTENDLSLCQSLAPTLNDKGLFFVGIDVIGDFITEINVTSPTGVREISKIFDLNISTIFYDKLLAKLKR